MRRAPRERRTGRLNEPVGSTAGDPSDPGLPRTRVLVDGYFVDRAYGFGRYVRELLLALDRHAPFIHLVVVVPPRGEAAARELVVRGHVEVMPARVFPLWEQWTIPRVARRLGCSVVHFPYQTSAWAWPRRASVITVHDLIPFEPLPAGARVSDAVVHYYRRWALALWGRRSRRVVAVSPATREELRERLGVAAVVVPNVVDAFVWMHPADQTVPQDGPRYLLHRGGDAPHKNTGRVIEAFAAVRERYADIELQVFGMSERAQHFAGAATDGVHFVGRVDDAALARLYRQALAVVAPSLHEGFGLSLIEAFGFGTALITSDRAPMSEIAGGGAGLMVDPESVEQIRTAMLRLVDEPALRRELVDEGGRRMQAYSGAEVAQRLQETYLGTGTRTG
jgi:glycosyltransferase involved in cell wall biosynthesis